MVHWQVQQAKRHFSELLRAASHDGVQHITSHGREVAVVISADQYRRLIGVERDFKDALVEAKGLFDDFPDTTDLRREMPPSRDSGFDVA